MTISNPPKPPAADPETQLLLHCARGGTAAEAIQRLLKPSLDWNRIFHAAARHGLEPALYSRLRNLDEHLPEHVIATLSSGMRQNARNSLALTAGLLRAWQALESAGIAALPYKGPVLALEAYGNVALRQYSDLDILIRPRDFAAARAALATAAFSSQLTLSLAEERAYLAAGAEWPFADQRQGLLLEIQWRLAPRFFCLDVPFDEIYGRRTEVVVEGVALPSLSAEDTVLILAIHAAKHAFARIAWLADIAAFCANREVNWAVVNDRAQQWHVRRILNVTLMLCSRFLAMPIPSLLQSQIERDSHAGVLADRFTAALLDPALAIEPTSLPYFVVSARLRERIWERMRFFFRLAITPSMEEWQLVRLPGALQPMYRAIRIGRLLARVPQFLQRS